MKEKTSIQVDKDILVKLRNLKLTRRDSYTEIIERLIENEQNKGRTDPQH